jgi:subtilisin family serine protease
MNLGFHFFRAHLADAARRCASRLLLALALLLVVLPAHADTPPAAPGQVIVRLAANVSVQSLLTDYATTLACGPADAPSCSIPERNIHLVAVPPALSDDAFLLLLKADPRVLFAEPDFFASDVNPEGSTRSIFFRSTFAEFSSQPLIDDIGLSVANPAIRGAGTVVAILDTGVDLAHPAFAGRLLPGKNFIDSTQSVDDVGDGIDSNANGVADEMTGHGTLAAGLVLLAAPDTFILPLKIMDSDGVVTTFALARAMFHAIDQNVDVISISLGTIADPLVLRQAVDEAVLDDTIIVAAVGNDDRQDEVRSPASLSALGVVAVAALDSNNVRASFTNFGPFVTLAAPGVDIHSTAPDGYGRASGTSFAAPLVAGAAARLRSICGLESPGTILDTLMNTAAPIDALNPGYAGLLGAGLLSVDAAVSALSATRPAGCIGEQTCDGLVTDEDFSRFVYSYDRLTVPAARAAADLNRDQLVDDSDFQLFAAAYNDLLCP